MEKKLRIGNIGLLNLLNATEESIQNIEHIGNIGIILIHKSNYHLVDSLKIGNVSEILVIPDGFQYIDGNYEISDKNIDSLVDSQKLYVTGNLILKNQQPFSLLNTKIDRLLVGKCIISRNQPDPDFMSKLTEEPKNIIVTNGEFEYYKELVLDDQFLSSSHETVFVDVSLEAYQEISEQSLKNIGKLICNKKVKISEENYELLKNIMDIRYPDKLKIIPKKTVIIKNRFLGENDLRINMGKKILFRSVAIIRNTLISDDFANCTGIISQENIFIPENLYEHISGKIADQSKIILYRGNILSIEDELVLKEEDLFNSEEKLNIVNFGSLEFGKISKDTLKREITAVYNYGGIQIDSLLKQDFLKIVEINEGYIEFKDSENQESEKKEDDKYTIVNIGSLKL